jgi:hypothetical protein
MVKTDPLGVLSSKLAVYKNVTMTLNEVALGQVFSKNFGFPCQFTFHLLLHNHRHYHPRLAK